MFAHFLYCQNYNKSGEWLHCNIIDNFFWVGCPPTTHSPCPFEYLLADGTVPTNTHTHTDTQLHLHAHVIGAISYLFEPSLSMNECCCFSACCHCHAYHEFMYSHTHTPTTSRLCANAVAMRKWLRLLVFNCQAINRSVECSKLSRVFVTNCFHGRPPYVTVLHCVTALRKKVHALIMHFCNWKKAQKTETKRNTHNSTCVYYGTHTFTYKYCRFSFAYVRAGVCP